MKQSGQAKLEDYLGDHSFSLWSRIVHVITWEFQSAVNLYGQMNLKLWIYCAVIFIYTAFLPIGFNFDNDEVVTIFLWGCAKSDFVSFELATGGLQIRQARRQAARAVAPRSRRNRPGIWPRALEMRCRPRRRLRTGAAVWRPAAWESK